MLLFDTFILCFFRARQIFKFEKEHSSSGVDCDRDKKNIEPIEVMYR
ncbi:hypothetical protein P700755_000785 [Psychroflexus torquis ATCC 700755]|uniref:Uncharacterized protein n=1 Tax=Psychroflexus torquis (strain ATCC 700755 / CIP 106069 / ACAM 623) TaxID=313595 RepID=K4IAY9_PSYTT|nr:hypothetical protein P700755_000785 [Psychroflexus torquis ATCC 700755]